MSAWVTAGIVLGAVALATALHAVLVAPARLRLVEVRATLPGLPSAFEGYVLAVLADLHYGATLRPRRVAERAVRMAHRAQPDLIVLLGDYGLSLLRYRRLSRRLYRWAMDALSPLLASLRARDGVVAVLGNHDYESDAAEVAAWLRAIGVRVLVNECIILERDGARLAVGGVDDMDFGTVDPFGGCGAIAPEVPRVIISHNPDGVLALAPDARADLVVSGHTHGGQLVLPVVGALVRRSRVCGAHSARGWVPGSRVPLYVTAGVGVVVPIRFRCPPEVVVLTLSGTQ